MTIDEKDVKVCKICDEALAAWDAIEISSSRVLYAHNRGEHGNEPQNGNRMILRQELQQFAEMMESKMRKHDLDRGNSWKSMDKWVLLGRLNKEIYEATQVDDSSSEWADVANYAMFLWWQANKKAWESISGHGGDTG